MADLPPMPYEHLMNWVVQMHMELVPRALQELIDERWRSGEIQGLNVEPLLRRVRGFDTDAQFRAWMHARAGLRSWAVLHLSLKQLYKHLFEATPGDPAARELVAELVACPTVSNLARIAIRGPVPPAA